MGCTARPLKACNVIARREKDIERTEPLKLGLLDGMEVA